jgi:hypothetical protein
LRAEFSAEETIIARSFSQDKLREKSVAFDEAAMGRSRKRDAVKVTGSRVRRNVNGGEQL